MVEAKKEEAIPTPWCALIVEDKWPRTKPLKDSL